MAATLPLAAGCYSYTPIAAEPAPVGENVRLYVTRTGAPEFLSVVESVDLVPEIRGRVEGSENGSLLLRMPVRPEGSASTAVVEIAQRVRIPTDQILSMDLQRFSPVRTGLLVAGGAAAGAFILYVIIDAARDDNSIDDPDPPLLSRGFSIPIG